MLARTINDPSKPSIEVIYNLELLHHSFVELNKTSFLTSFKLFIDQINSSSKKARPQTIKKFSSTSLKIRCHHPIYSPPMIYSILKNRKFELYKTVFYNGVRFSSEKLTNTISSRTHDGCLMYYDSKDMTKLCIGFLKNVVKLMDVVPNEIVFIIEQVKISSTADILILNGLQYECDNVLRGSLSAKPYFAIVSRQKIKEKLAFRPQQLTNKNDFYFYRYPNFSEST